MITSIIDKAIKDISNTIVNNIDKLNDDVGLLSQNVLSQLRNLVEHIALKIDTVENGKADILAYGRIQEALSYIRKRGQYINLFKLHESLQITASHYTMDEENSERIMHRYLEKLYRIKDFMNTRFGMEILENIHKFPLKKDTQTEEYYKKIIEKVKLSIKTQSSRMERCYIQKKKPLFIKGRIYYELTVTLAKSNISKYDRVIVFTKHNVKANYAVKLWLNQAYVKIIEQDVPIKIAVDWQVSIRPCEFGQFSRIFGSEIKNIGKSKEADRINEFLTKESFNLVDILNLPKNEFDEIKSEIHSGLRMHSIFTLLDACRNIVDGKNVVNYLLHNMTYKVIRNQISDANRYLSNLNLQYGCIPFSQMPYCSHLIQHKIGFQELVESVGIKGREHEIIARKVKYNTENLGRIYTPLSELGEIEKTQNLIQTYNARLYPKHRNRTIKIEKNLAYIDEYESTAKQIIEIVKERTNGGIKGYKNSVQAWIDLFDEVDCDKKKEILPLLFEQSKVAFIYGSAGTGKTTIIKHLTDYLSGLEKKAILYLAHTNTAVDNLRKRVGVDNGTFKTITKFKQERVGTPIYDLVVVDECSTVSNKDILEVISNVQSEMMLFVGDTYQIEAIEFGNWFKMIQCFVDKSLLFELDKPYRTSDENLLCLWGCVRQNDGKISDIIVRNAYSKNLDETVFFRNYDDEIILCLNYDGLYGINNINRLLQSANKGKKVEIGLSTYKVNDPILFNETRRFGSLLHNNLKGKIIDFNENITFVEFFIEIDKAITELHLRGTDAEFVSSSSNQKSIIKFVISKTVDTDEEDDNTLHIVPFQVAYAMSIHKSQGLEYDSVKVVISNEIDERITHNIFYTAITRAKKHLKIFWSNETMQNIISSFTVSEENKDFYILKNKFFSEKTDKL